MITISPWLLSSTEQKAQGAAIVMRIRLLSVMRKLFLYTTSPELLVQI